MHFHIVLEFQILLLAIVKELSISSIIHICEGLNIELKDFFDSNYFKDVEAIERFDKNSSKVV